jgi:threonine/homoserine/homoserine lactone efflux protein
VVSTLVPFLAISLVVICTPGQDTALTIRNTLAGGRASGMGTAAGVGIGNAIWTVAASAGVVAVLRASEPVFHALKLAGAGYLVYLGLHSLRAALRRGASGSPGLSARAALTPRRGLRQGVVSNLGNPKVAIFFASLLPQFAPGGPGSFAALLALGFLFSAITWTWLTLYAVAVARARRALTDGPLRRALDAIFGFVLVVFGIRLATERT